MTVVTDLLQCPACHAELTLENNSQPACAQCGYRLTVLEPPANDCRVTILPALTEFVWEIAKGYAVTRSFMHVCVKRFVRPRGTILDLGSGKKPSYAPYLRGDDLVYIKADGIPAFNPDILVNLDNPLPLKDGAVDTVLLFNVLEHTYHYDKTLSEIYRVLKADGTLYLLVPFLIKIHGSPCDYFRYTHFALHKLLSETGFQHIDIYTDGGIFKYLSLLLNWSSRYGIGYLFYPLYLAFYGLDSLLGLITRGKYQRNLPIGYFIICTKRAGAGTTA